LIALLAAITAHADGLTGQWQGQLNGQLLSLQLNADGSGTLDGNAIQYAAQNSLLMIQSDNGLMAYTFALQGNTLVVQGGDLAQALTLKRGVAGKTAKVDKQAQPTAGQLNPAVLAGKWCLVKSFSANAGGGSYSSSCFILEANGRYSYQNERSMDAYGGGMWGGTSGQSGDTGRWTATRDSITGVSDGGQTSTYRLELRNHPKNNDPMICLDGDCYVTFYQKPPW
jgi:hypothetical protein